MQSHPNPSVDTLVGYQDLPLQHLIMEEPIYDSNDLAVETWLLGLQRSHPPPPPPRSYILISAPLANLGGGHGELIGGQHSVKMSPRWP